MQRKWENFIALGLVVIFLNVTLKGCAIKEKIDKASLEFKMCTSKDTKKDPYGMGRNICKS